MCAVYPGHEREEEFAQIQAMTASDLGSSNRPVLVLSCVSRAGTRRIPCIYMAHELHLNRLARPWLVSKLFCSLCINYCVKPTTFYFSLMVANAG